MRIKYSIFENQDFFKALRAATRCSANFLHSNDLHYRPRKLVSELTGHLTTSVNFYGSLMAKYSKVIDGKTTVPEENVDAFNKEWNEFLNTEFETKWDDVPLYSLQELGLTEADAELLHKLTCQGKEQQHEENSSKEVYKDDENKEEATSI